MSLRFRIIFILIALAIQLVVFNPTPSRADEADAVRACDAGIAAACEDLAWFHAQGANADPGKWVAYGEKACDLNSARACNNLGVGWSTGKYGTGQVDLARGLAYYRKACDLSHGIACFNYANMHRLGEGVAVDMKVALDNYTRACELNAAKGCTELGIMYYEGNPVPKNILMAHDLFQKGCKLGSTLSCKNADMLLPTASPPADSASK